MIEYLRRLQSHVEALHDVHTNLDVGAYVVSDQEHAQIPGARSGLPEQLFVQQSGDELAMALYIDPNIGERLRHDDPLLHLHPGNIQSYCVALEGVSHFVCVAHRATLGRPVSAMELELQAEVDKFVHGWTLLIKQGIKRSVAARALRKWLFGGYRLHHAVAESERGRYHAATRAARRFCFGLAQRYHNDRDEQKMMRHCRDFFRRGLSEKMRAA